MESYDHTATDEFGSTGAVGEDGAPVTTRDKLLEAASSLMRTRDTIDVSLSDIAQTAKVNAALVKYYFGNKRGMVLALLERDLTNAVTQLRELVDMDLRPTLKMKYHLSALIKMYFYRPYLNRLLTAVMRDGNEPAAREIALSYCAPIIEAYQRMVEDGVAKGEFKHVDAKFLYFTIIGACDQIFSARYVLRYVHGIEEVDDDLRRAYARQVIDLIMCGLVVEGTPLPD
ncbi:TetR family transcriptional regulator [Acuticoccus sp. I52.16.1]|uniref:TetR family transcriptional regulator n=1 Tax=Acuticoccus sp. I52.16.1 TaxID=2928472 RepID=UPI001FD371AA|nr:TetR family transcriptional regulator [Acuticoccus sp. I52.16.1]UOM34742.1 TetR family transcriptional regulator [Acuticoccus sp. I52.16.1]